MVLGSFREERHESNVSGWLICLHMQGGSEIGRDLRKAYMATGEGESWVNSQPDLEWGGREDVMERNQRDFPRDQSLHESVTTLQTWKTGRKWHHGEKQTMTTSVELRICQPYVPKIFFAPVLPLQYTYTTHTCLPCFLLGPPSNSLHFPLKVPLWNL